MRLIPFVVAAPLSILFCFNFNEAFVKHFLPLKSISASAAKKIITVNELRNLNSPPQGAVYTDDGGQWLYDPNDNTLEDNTGTVIVTATGLRFKRILKDSIVDITWFGADKTGMTDCSTQFRKAQAAGNVYFPTGTYLMSPVDLRTNRKYFGDGMGKTIIKALHTKIKMLWGISTYDFDKSKHAISNMENITISDMTFDYNFNTGWVDYYSVIIFKGHPGNYIKNVKIQRIEFIDNKKQVHPDLIGGNGKDAWSINLSSFADSTQDILVDNCVSRAESHQFVGGGGSYLKRITVTNNYILRPQANGIAFTTVSNKDVTFADFTVTDNTIVDAFGSAILFGNDPGTLRLDGGVQTFTGLLVADNKISFSNYMVYGKSYRTKKSFPYVINLSGAEPYMKNVIIKNNNINVNDDYSGGDICLGKIRSYAFKRAPINILKDIKQPPVNANVEVTFPDSLQDGTKLYHPGTFVKIDQAGIYEIVAVKKKSMTIKLTNWAVHKQSGRVIPSGSQVTFIGGKLEDVQFLDNQITGKKSLRIIPGGRINMLTVRGNNRLAFTMPYPDCIIDNSSLTNNIDFSFSQSNGIINGTMSGNKMLKQGISIDKKIKAINTGITNNSKTIQNNLKMVDNN